MTGKRGKTEQFMMLPRGLIESDAWRDLTINARRFLDFLMIEHMRHGGRDNGYLLAPRRQLTAFGIGAHYISGAIDEVDRLGLVDCKRGIGRRPSCYSRTWLKVKGGGVATDRWKVYRSVASAEQHSQGAAGATGPKPDVGCRSENGTTVVSAVSTSNECQTALTKPVVSAKEHSQGAVSSSAKQHSLSRDSYQGGADTPLSGAERTAADGLAGDR
jgi:hypothetical protein